ncbi:MAG: hypothetical protein KA712_03935 [Myxococcales bacterium]|nr:hypothetical protein [Myxococcales bacterium]
MNSRLSSFFTTVVAAVTVLVAWAGAPRLALAQGYAPVADKDPTTIAANPFIAGAYGFIWVALVVYLVVIAKGLTKAHAEVNELRRKLDRQA